LSGFWWQCKESDLTVTKVDPATAFIGKPSDLKVFGTNLDKEDTYSFGNGIMVKPTASAADGTSVNLSITVDSTLQPGSRTLIVVDKHCRTVTHKDAINVTPDTSAAGGGKDQIVQPAPQRRDSIKTKPAKKQTPAPSGNNG
jgi:hypothetical protein